MATPTGPPTVTVRCPTCGGGLRVVYAPSPPTQWFPCPHCHVAVPVVVPRDPPPLYSWEVLPGLYPPLAPPRPPRGRPVPLASVALVAVAAIGVVLAGAFAYYGMQASAPARFVVSGTVYTNHSGVRQPVPSAQVVLTLEGNRTFGINYTDSAGAFVFTNVPSGGLELSVTASGFGPTELRTFVAPSYDAGSTGLSIPLRPGSFANVSRIELSPFVSLEGFLSAVGAGAVLAVGAAVLAGYAAIAIRRPGGGTVGVLGGGAGVGLPAVVLALELGGALPLVTVGAALAGGFGASAIVLAAAALATGSGVGNSDR